MPKTATRDPVVEIAAALLEAVESSTSSFGVPGGHLYAATMSILSLDQFQAIMGVLVKIGKVERHGECYRAVKEAS